MTPAPKATFLLIEVCIKLGWAVLTYGINNVNTFNDTASVTTFLLRSRLTPWFSVLGMSFVTLWRKMVFYGRVARNN